MATCSHAGTAVPAGHSPGLAVPASFLGGLQNWAPRIRSITVSKFLIAIGGADAAVGKAVLYPAELLAQRTPSHRGCRSAVAACVLLANDQPITANTTENP